LPETRNRELAGLADAMTTYRLTEGLILTSSTEETLQLPHGTVIIKPVWKWLLEPLRG